MSCYSCTLRGGRPGHLFDAPPQTMASSLAAMVELRRCKGNGGLHFDSLPEFAMC